MKMSEPAVPALLLIPGDEYLDFRSMYAIATAYAHAGLIVSEHGVRNGRIEFTFPAVVCSSFAVELFLKFFLMVDKAERGVAERQVERAHEMSKLWPKVTHAHKALIAGMFRNSTGTPLMNASDRRIEIFEEALAAIGDKPFVQWRYVHELQDDALMSHAAISLVVDALGFAAQYVMQTKAQKP
jgi:hypothetical protein